MTSEPVKHALFITTIPDLQTPHYLGEHIAHVTERALERVVIVLLSPLFNGGLPLSKRSPGTTTLGVSHAGSWTAVQRILTYVYVKSSAAAQAKGRILLDIDVLLHGTDTVLDARIATSPDVLFRIDGDELPIQHSHQLGALPTVLLPFEGPGNQDTPAEHVTFATPSLYPVVALGGTFDHLHAGHKILLFMAAWISSWKVIVGITDDALLQKKSNKEVIEDFSRRAARIRGFLELVRPGLILDLVPISDVAGPTGWDANIQALVVSKETLSGGAAIDKIRENAKLPPLRTFIIDVISATETSIPGEDAQELKVAKMSSTAIRQWIVDNRMA